MVAVKLNHSDILKKAIEKAIAGGWSGCSVTHSTTEKWTITSMDRLCVYFITGSNVYFHPNEFIFSHDFAKALWGEGESKYHVRGLVDWQYHLQMMVIADDPIEYLGNNI